MYFGEIKKSFSVGVFINRNGVLNGSHWSNYYEVGLSKTFDAIFREFKLFKGEKIEKIVIKPS